MIIKQIKINEDAIHNLSITDFYEKYCDFMYPVGFCISKEKLTLWLIDKDEVTSNLNSFVDINELADAYDKLIVTDSKYLYRNPPLDLWFLSHKQWCIKLAKHLASKYNLNADETLSDVYFFICREYNKNNYVGSLNWLFKVCESNIKMMIRDNNRDKRRTIIDADSLDRTFNEGSDDDEICLGDLIPGDTYVFDERRYNKLISLLKKSLLDYGFSKNEAILIIDCKGNLLTKNRYSRFLKWRKEHLIKEFMDEIF